MRSDVNPVLRSVRSLIGEMVNTTNNVFSNKHYLNLVGFGAVNGDFIQVARGGRVE